MSQNFSRSISNGRGIMGRTEARPQANFTIFHRNVSQVGTRAPYQIGAVGEVRACVSFGAYSSLERGQRISASTLPKAITQLANRRSARSEITAASLGRLLFAHLFVTSPKVQERSANSVSDKRTLKHERNAPLRISISRYNILYFSHVLLLRCPP